MVAAAVTLHCTGIPFKPHTGYQVGDLPSSFCWGLPGGRTPTGWLTHADTLPALMHSTPAPFLLLAAVLQWWPAEADARLPPLLPSQSRPVCQHCLWSLPVPEHGPLEVPLRLVL